MSSNCGEIGMKMFSSEQSLATQQPNRKKSKELGPLVCLTLWLMLQPVGGQHRMPTATTPSPISFSFSIEEELPVGHVVGHVLLDALFGSAVNFRAGNIKFGVFRDNPRTDHFYVVPSNGTILINKTIDRDALCYSPDFEFASCFVDLPIRIVLNGTLHNIPVRVFITDRNDNVPSWSESTVQAMFKEGPRTGGARFDAENLHRLPLAVDRDVGNNSIIRYMLVGDNDTLSTFELLYKAFEKPKGLYLRPVRELNRETREHYDMQIEAIDGGGQKGRLPVRVTVLDINDNAPQFVDDLFNFTIPESAAVDDVIYTLLATDPDSGAAGEVEYSVTHKYCTPNVMPFPFNVSQSSGRLYVQHGLDFETTRMCGMMVTARDHGDPPLSSSIHVLVHIQDVNDEEPTISVTNVDLQAQLSVAENNVTERLGWLFVSDKDTVNGVLQCYADSNDAIALESTRNDDKTFSIRLLKSFDREVQPVVNVSVECTDNGQPPRKRTRLLSIKITDVNDCAPEFSQSTYTADIYENEPAHTLVTVLRAFDFDEGENSRLAYRFADEPASNEIRAYFQLSTSNGSLYSLIPFDRETRRSFSFRVVASDFGTPQRLSATATVEVNVIDRNDNAPQFTDPLYRFRTEEEQLAGAFIGRVDAVDLDVGENARVSYRLEEGEQRFSINERGEITTGRIPLDREQVDTLPLIVFAFDHGLPSRTSTTTALIVVLDKNDNKPVFRPSFHNETIYFHFSDCRGGKPLTSLTATDADQNDNGRVTYRLLSVSQSKPNSSQSMFVIDADSGILTTAQDLSEADCGFYKLVVEACDAGKPKQCEITVLTVYINRFARSTAPNGFDPFASDDRSTAGVLNSMLNLFGLNEGRNVVLVIVLSCVAGALALILLATILYVRKKELAARSDSRDDYDDELSCGNAKNTAGGMSPNVSSRMSGLIDGRADGAAPPQSRNGSRHAQNMFISPPHSRAQTHSEKCNQREAWPCRVMTEDSDEIDFNPKEDSAYNTPLKFVANDENPVTRWQPGTFRRSWHVTKTRAIPNFSGESPGTTVRTARNKASSFQRSEDCHDVHTLQAAIPYSSVRQTDQNNGEGAENSTQSCSDYVPMRGKRKDLVVSWFARCSPVDEDFERPEAVPRRSELSPAYRHLLATSPQPRSERTMTAPQRDATTVYLDCRSFGADSGICEEPILNSSNGKLVTPTWDCMQRRSSQENVKPNEANAGNNNLPAPVPAPTESNESPATC